jgi:polysaccharide deacetylase 2 family uncharacterized protein YibQ
MTKKIKRQVRPLPVLFVIAAILAVAFLSYKYLLAPLEKEPTAPPPEKPRPAAPPRTEQGGEADYRSRSRFLQREVDRILKEKNAVVEKARREDKQTARSDGGKIEWVERSGLVSLDSQISLEEVKELLSKELAVHKGIVYRQEQSIFDGREAERLDIALADVLGGDPLTLIVDKLYFAAALPAAASGKLAVIVDDCGYDLTTVTRMTALKQKITFAVIPYRQFSPQALAMIRSRGKEAMLHLPMEPLDSKQQSEDITITVNMPDEEIKSVAQKAISQLPGIVGVNNHQGSRATADERVMRAVLSVIKDNRLFFVDSRTQAGTVAYKVAERLGVKTALNGAFMDGEANVGYIKNRLRQAGTSALKNGSYIAICHARPHTVTALTEMVDELEKMGVEFVFVSALTR